MKYIILIILIIFFSANANNYGEKWLKNKQSTKPKSDSIIYSIKINGPANEVTVNNKKQLTTNNNEPNQNTIQINGAGNKAIINTDDAKGKVTIIQNGNNNKASTTQSTKNHNKK